MGKAELEFHIVEKRDWLGRIRYNTRIVDTDNHEILFASNQGYSRLIDANRAIGKVQRYAAIANVKQVEK